MAFGLRQGQERSSENTGSPGYEQTHGYRFLSIGLCDDVLSLRRRGPDDIGQLADVAGRRPGHDERVEVRISLDALDPPAGRVRVIPGSDDAELCFTGWLGLLRVLYQVMGSPAAAPDTEDS